MTQWKPELPSTGGHLYMALAESIRDAVASGVLRVGDRLPPHRQLAKQLGCTTGTVARGYGLAISWGLLASRVGRGTEVRDPERGDERLLYLGAQDRVDLGLLLPAPLDDAALEARAFGDGFADLGHDVLRRVVSGYAPEMGYQTHRSNAVSWLEQHGVECRAEQVMITHGAQEAFLLLLTVFARPGETVLTEELSYLGLKSLCSLLRIRLAPVRMDGDGIDVDDLTRMQRATGARLMVTCPTLHNPTGITTTATRRRKIAEVVRRQEMLIVEDAPFVAMVHDRAPMLVSLAPENCFHIASFSKYVSPSLRVAFLKGPERFMDQLARARHGLTISGSSLQAEVLSRWITLGLTADLCQWQREEIQRRLRLARRILGSFIPRGQTTSPFLWLPLPPPWRSSEFVRAAREKKVMVLDAEQFVIGRAQAPHTVRISLTTAPTADALGRALTELVPLLEQGPAAH